MVEMTGDLKEQLAEVKQRLDIVVNEVWKMKMQTGVWSLGDVHLGQDSVNEPRQDLGHRKLRDCVGYICCCRCACWCTTRFSCCPNV